MMNTIEVYAYCCKGIAGAPADVYGLHVTGDAKDQPKPLAKWAEQSYWALGMDADGFPSVLAHVYYEGPLPGESQRDEINHHVQRLTGKLLFNQE